MADVRAALAHVEVGPPHMDGLLLQHGWATPWRFEDAPDNLDATVWQSGLRWDDKPEWSVAFGYVVGDIVRGLSRTNLAKDFHNSAFRCTLTHASAYDNEPGFGANWKTHWEMGETEIIPEINALGPRGRPALDDVYSALSEWTPQGANKEWWREARPAGAGNCKHLYFFRAYPGSSGLVISKWVAYNFWVRLLRFAPVDGEVWPCEVSLGLRSLDPSYYLHQWRLDLPAFSDGATENKYPSLWRYTDTSDEPVKWVEWQSAGGAGNAGGQRFLEQIVWIEQVGPYLRIWLSSGGSGETWLWKRIDNEEGITYAFELAIGVQGGCVMACPQPLIYPARAEVRPKSYSHVGAGWNTNIVHVASKHEPEGTSCAVATEVNPLDPRGYIPAITFRTDTIEKRAICWRVDSGSEPEFQPASGAMATVKCKWVKWRRDNTWQGATLEAELAASESLPTWKGNEKITLSIADDPELVDPPTDPPTKDPEVWVPKFTGYLDEPEWDIEDPNVNVAGRAVRITARDWFAARGPKKVMAFTSSPCGRTVGAWFRTEMWRAGVPTAMIDVAADVESMVIADLDPRSKPRFEYGHEQGKVQAINEIAESLGLIAGNDSAGKCFIRKPPVYSGTPSWTLDEDTTSSADHIRSLESSRSNEQFRNYVLGIARRRGATDFALYRNEASHKTDGDPRYIGDDWWAVRVAADCESAAVVAEREYAERQQWTHTIVWKTAQNQCGPDSFVKVQVANLNLPTDSIFQIVSESGEIRGHKCTIEYVGRVLQYGA